MLSILILYKVNHSNNKHLIEKPNFWTRFKRHGRWAIQVSGEKCLRKTELPVHSSWIRIMSGVHASNNKGGSYRYSRSTMRERIWYYITWEVKRMLEFCVRELHVYQFSTGSFLLCLKEDEDSKYRIRGISDSYFSPDERWWHFGWTNVLTIDVMIND